MKRLTLLLVAASFFIGSGIANADFSIATSTDGITWNTVATSGDETFATANGAVSVDGLTLTGMQMSSNWTGDLSGSGTLASTVRVTGTNSLTSGKNPAPIPLYIAFSISGFQLPVAPPGALQETVSLSGNTINATGTISIESFADQANRLVSTANPPPLGNEAGPVSSPFSAVNGSNSFDSATGSLDIASLSAPFSIDQIVEITITANGSRGMQFDGSANLAPTATPEPATVFLFAIGSAVFGIGWKRRKQNPSASV